MNANQMARIACGIDQWPSAGEPSMSSPYAVERQCCQEIVLSGTPRQIQEHMAAHQGGGLDLVTTHEALGTALDALNQSPGPVEEYAHRVDLAKRLMDESVADMRAGHWTSAESYRSDAYTTVRSLGPLWLEAYEAANGPAEMCEHGNPEWVCRQCAEVDF